MSIGTEVPVAKRRRPAGRITAIMTAALVVGLTATAVAAHPKAGRHYRGTIAKLKVNGFAAPVSFTVSADGHKLVHFTYGTLGCQGGAGFLPGVTPFRGAFLMPVATIPVATNGQFAVHNSVRTVTSTKGVPLVTKSITSVTGRFTSPKRATGAITLSQRFQPRHGPSFSCGPVNFAFTATPR